MRKWLHRSYFRSTPSPGSMLVPPTGRRGVPCRLRKPHLIRWIVPVMRQDGFPAKLLNLIPAYYAAHTRTGVRRYGKELDFFTIQMGFRQGCVLSPIIFNFVIDCIFSQGNLEDLSGTRVEAISRLLNLPLPPTAVLGSPMATYNTLLMVRVETKINALKTGSCQQTCPVPSKSLFISLERPCRSRRVRISRSTFTTVGQGKGEISIWIKCVRSAFSCLNKLLWSCWKIYLAMKRLYLSGVI